MPNDDLIKYIGELHSEQMSAIPDLRAAFAEHKGGVDARLATVEEDKKKQDQRQWIHSLVVLGISFANHALAKTFSWRF
jgi:hypothetical protein